jgi:uncharacterized protein (DUF1697 family)
MAVWQAALMPRQVAFLRAVMLGRQGLLRELVLQAFVDSGAGDPRSYLATGNVSFDADDDGLSDLTSLVERAIAKTLGRHEPIFVRSVARLAELAAGDPFAGYRTDDVHERCVTFLPGDRRWDRALPMASRRTDVSLVAAEGPEVFSVTRLISGRPGTPGTLIEREIGAPVTTRNWNTIERILRAPA